MTGRAGRRHVILCFADMAKSDSFSRFNLVIADTYVAIFTLGNMPAVVANDTSGVAFFVDEDSDSFALFEIFFYSFARQLRKIRSNLLAHIDQIDALFDSLYVVIKTFIIHYRRLRMIKCRRLRMIIILHSNSVW